MNDYLTDIEEIISFINCSLNKEKRQARIEHCLSRFTKKIGESFLDNRAKYIRVQVQHDSALKEAFEFLAAFCDNNNPNACEYCSVKNYCNTYIEKRRVQVCDGPSIIDLFCGAGGLSLGFVQEGFRVVLANDIEQCCIDTYSHNHPEIPRQNILLGDIKVLVENIDKYITEKTIDVIVGGPPCQGFSMANRQRIIDDPRNHLYKEYVEIVKKVKPKFFVMENVRGMLCVAPQVVEDFKQLGYNVAYKVLNAKDFGVPQHRERLIYVGNRIGEDNSAIFDELSALANRIPSYVLRDALFGLRPLVSSRVRNATAVDSFESGYKIDRNTCDATNGYINLINAGRNVSIVTNHKARYNNNRDIEIYSRLNQGDRSDDPKIADIMPYTSRNDIFKDKYYKLEEDKICKTITAHMKFDCNMYIHPTQARGLTPREAARIQSYPDDYYFRGAYTKTYMQIGNSVPPLLGKALAHVIKAHLRGK